MEIRYVKRVTDTGSIGSYFGSKFHCIYSFLSMSVLARIMSFLSEFGWDYTEIWPINLTASAIAAIESRSAIKSLNLGSYSLCFRQISASRMSRSRGWWRVKAQNGPSNLYSTRYSYYKYGPLWRHTRTRINDLWWERMHSFWISYFHEAPSLLYSNLVSSTDGRFSTLPGSCEDHASFHPA